MQDSSKKFEHAQSPVLRNLAFGLLTLLVLAMLVSNRSVWWVTTQPHQRPDTLFFYLATIVFGVMFAQSGLLVIWTVLGPPQLWRRLLFLVCASIALTIAWVLGYSQSLDTTERLKWLDYEFVYDFGIFPLAFFAGCLPLLVLRLAFGRSLAKVNETVERRPITISSLMSATFIVAFVFAGLQLPLQLPDAREEIWTATGVLSAFAFCGCLLILLPAVLLLLSQRRRFWLWAIMLFVANSGVGALAMLAANKMGAFVPFSYSIFMLVSTTAIVIAGIGIIRLFGFRLARVEPRRSR